VPAIRQALIKLNGSVYRGDGAYLCGTIAIDDERGFDLVSLILRFH
jgi:hypothetical protein